MMTNSENHVTYIVTYIHSYTPEIFVAIFVLRIRRQGTLRLLV